MPENLALGPDQFRGSGSVHVAVGMYWDMKARHELGLRGICVNRRGEPGNPDWPPCAEVPDLGGAATLLLPA
jgi:2-haloacid dehalogenase